MYVQLCAMFHRIVAAFMPCERASSPVGDESVHACALKVCALMYVPTRFDVM